MEFSLNVIEIKVNLKILSVDGAVVSHTRCNSFDYLFINSFFTEFSKFSENI